MLLGDGITPEFCQVQTYATVPVVQFRSQTSALYKLSFDAYYISLFSLIFCVPTGEVTRTFLGLDLGIHRNIPDRLHIIVGATNPIQAWAKWDMKERQLHARSHFEIL